MGALHVVTVRTVRPAVADSLLRPDFVRVAGEVFEQGLQVIEVHVRGIDRLRDVVLVGHKS
jgi:hypothetical protein